MLATKVKLWCSFTARACQTRQRSKMIDFVSGNELYLTPPLATLVPQLFCVTFASIICVSTRQDPLPPNGSHVWYFRRLLLPPPVNGVEYFVREKIHNCQEVFWFQRRSREKNAVTHNPHVVTQKQSHTYRFLSPSPPTLRIRGFNVTVPVLQPTEKILHACGWS